MSIQYDRSKKTARLEIPYLLSRDDFEGEISDVIANLNKKRTELLARFRKGEPIRKFYIEISAGYENVGVELWGERLMSPAEIETFKKQDKEAAAAVRKRKEAEFEKLKKELGK